MSDPFAFAAVPLPTPPAPEPLRAFRPLVELSCNTCGETVAQLEGAIYVCTANVAAYCGPRCAADAGVWPWVGTMPSSAIP